MKAGKELGESLRRASPWSHRNPRRHWTVGGRLRNSAGKNDVANVKNLADVTAYLGVTRTKKKGFVNMTLRGEDGLRVYQILTRAFSKIGKRQWDSPMARPIQTDIKKGLEVARKSGSKV